MDKQMDKQMDSNAAFYEFRGSHAFVDNYDCRNYWFG